MGKNSLASKPDCNLIKIYETLLTTFGPQYWWPAEGPEEMIIGALLTQNTTWKNVEKALAKLRKNNQLSFSAISISPLPELKEQIKPSGYFRQKSERLKTLAIAVTKAGGLRQLEQKTTSDLREWFLTLKGIGPETADSILLYAFKRPLFVIDAYTLRISKRHQWLPTTANYNEAQNYFTRQLPADPTLFNEYHALLVLIGKNFCRPKNPLCEKCPLNHLLIDSLAKEDQT